MNVIKKILLTIILISTFVLMSCSSSGKNINVKFQVNGGDTISERKFEIVDGVITGVPSPIREGYSFKGWYINASLTKAFISGKTLVEKDLTLYAKWEINRYTITFDSRGGSDVDKRTQEYNTVVTAPSEPMKIGYTFDGWYTESSLSNKYLFTTMPSKDLTLYAKWNINQYTIYFNSNGAGAISSKVQDYGTVVIAPANPTKAGYTFGGWYRDSSLTSLFLFTTMPAENVTLYAKWIFN